MSKKPKITTCTRSQERGPGVGPGRGWAQGTLELRRGGEEGQTAHKALLSTNELNLTASEPTSLPTPTPTDPETPLWRSTRSDDVEEEPERGETLELQEGGFKGGTAQGPPDIRPRCLRAPCLPTSTPNPEPLWRPASPPPVSGLCVCLLPS